MAKFLIALLALFSLNSYADAPTPNGLWHGMTQFMFTPYQAPAEQAVANLVLDLGADFKVAGISQELGCKVLGIASPGIAKHILKLDLTFSGCRNSHYNQRVQGHIAGRDDGAATLSLQWISVTPPLRGNYTLDGTFRR